MSEVRILAEGLRFPEGPIAIPDGSILLVEIAAARLTRVFADGSVATIAELGGGPNGAAIGPDGRCYICNNGGTSWHEKDGRLLPGLTLPEFAGGYIQAVDLSNGNVEVLYRNCDGVPLNGPNDIVFDANGGFWFTDHGHAHRHTRDRGVVYYAKSDGSEIRKAIFPIETPNGIGLSPDGSLLYVAETITGRLWVYEVAEPGVVSRKVRNILGGVGKLCVGLEGFQLFDSLAVDQDGNILVGTIPSGISVFSPEGNLLEQIPMPDEFPTNVCFGGDDMKTLFITLSSTGKLASVASRYTGLKLHF
jgi:gluconolactonase